MHRCLPGSAGNDGFCSTCLAGTTPTADYSACIPCPVGTAGIDGTCSDCPPGMQANADRLSCEACPTGSAGIGTCSDCPPGMQPNSGLIDCVTCYSVGANLFSPSNGGICTPCSSGMYPFENRTACKTCEDGTAGVAGTCAVCPAGSTSTETRVSCQPCPAGSVSAVGSSCFLCEAGTQPTVDSSACESCVLAGPTYYRSGIDANQHICMECPARQIPAADLASCVCKPGTFNVVEFGGVTCTGGGQASALDGLECVDCPSCLACELGGNTSLREGWAFYSPNLAFRCPVEAGCKGPQLQPKEKAALMWLPQEDGFYADATLDSQCTEGYAGVLCGECQEGFNHIKVGRPCDPCDEGVVNVPLVLGFVLGGLIVGGIMISGVINTLADHGIITDIRLMIGL